MAGFLFLRVKSARPMTLQHLTVSVFENSKANDGFIYQKEFKTNLSYTFDSLVLTLYNVCSVHRGMFCTSGCVQYIGGYHEYIGGIP